MDLNQYVGKYVDISYPNGDGASGWIKLVEEEEGIPYYLVTDYGMAFPVTDETTVKVVDTPVDDPGMFNE